MSDEDRRKNRDALSWVGRLDDVDLFIPGAQFRQGRWRAGIKDHELTPGLRGLLNLNLEVLTCQVKARVYGSPDSRYDAIPYPYFVDIVKAEEMTREAFLATPPWKVRAVDIFALVEWEIPSDLGGDGRALPRVRILGCGDVQTAILDRERASSTGVERKYNWRTRKVDFDHAFGRRDEFPSLGLDLTTQLQAIPRLPLL